LRAEDRESLLALMTADAILVADGGGRVPAVTGPSGALSALPSS
jgi:hypothetical protein